MVVSRHEETELFFILCLFSFSCFFYEETELSVRKPDRDFIPLEEIEVLCGVSPEECEELLLVTIAVEDEGPKTGILVHAEGPNCPPNCYRIAETKRFKFVSSWELGREDQDIATGMTAAISRRGVADLRELGAVSSADKLLSEPRTTLARTR